MRLIVDVLPLSSLPLNSTNLSLNGASTSNGAVRFTIPVKGQQTFSDVWHLVEARYKKNYLTGTQAANFTIKKIQDVYGCDLDLDDTVAAIFGGVKDQEKLVIRVLQAPVDREVSLPPTSNLRPHNLRKRTLETIVEQDSSKRRRVDSYDSEENSDNAHSIQRISSEEDGYRSRDAVSEELGLAHQIDARSSGSPIIIEDSQSERSPSRTSISDLEAKRETPDADHQSLYDIQLSSTQSMSSPILGTKNSKKGDLDGLFVKPTLPASALNPHSRRSVSTRRSSSTSANEISQLENQAPILDHEDDILAEDDIEDIEESPRSTPYLSDQRNETPSMSSVADEREPSNASTPEFMKNPSATKRITTVYTRRSTQKDRSTSDIEEQHTPTPLNNDQPSQFQITPQGNLIFTSSNGPQSATAPPPQTVFMWYEQLSLEEWIKARDQWDIARKEEFSKSQDADQTPLPETRISGQRHTPVDDERPLNSSQLALNTEDPGQITNGPRAKSPMTSVKTLQLLRQKREALTATKSILKTQRTEIPESPAANRKVIALLESPESPEPEATKSSLRQTQLGFHRDKGKQKAIERTASVDPSESEDPVSVIQNSPANITASITIRGAENSNRVADESDEAYATPLTGPSTMKSPQEDTPPLDYKSAQDTRISSSSEESSGEESLLDAEEGPNKPTMESQATPIENDGHGNNPEVSLNVSDDRDKEMDTLNEYVDEGDAMEVEDHIPPEGGNLPRDLSPEPNDLTKTVERESKWSFDRVVNPRPPKGQIVAMSPKDDDSSRSSSQHRGSPSSGKGNASPQRDPMNGIVTDGKLSESPEDTSDESGSDESEESDSRRDDDAESSVGGEDEVQPRPNNDSRAIQHKIDKENSSDESSESDDSEESEADSSDEESVSGAVSDSHNHKPSMSLSQLRSESRISGRTPPSSPPVQSAPLNTQTTTSIEIVHSNSSSQSLSRPLTTVRLRSTSAIPPPALTKPPLRLSDLGKQPAGGNLRNLRPTLSRARVGLERMNGAHNGKKIDPSKEYLFKKKDESSSDDSSESSSSSSESEEDDEDEDNDSAGKNSKTANGNHTLEPRVGGVVNSVWSYLRGR